MPSLLVCYNQELSQTPSKTIAIFGADDKAKAGCDQDVVIYANGHQSVRTIVAEYRRQAHQTTTSIHSNEFHK